MKIVSFKQRQFDFKKQARIKPIIFIEICYSIIVVGKLKFNIFPSQKSIKNLFVRKKGFAQKLFIV